MDLTTTAKEQGSSKGKSSVKRKRRAWKDALAGKDFQLGGGKKSIIIKIFCYPMIVFCLAYISESLGNWNDIASIASVLFLILSCFEILVYTGQAFATEYKQKQVSSLLALPYSNEQIIFHKLKGAITLSLVPILYFFIACFSSNHTMTKFFEATFTIHTLTIIGMALALLSTSIFSGLTGKVKRSFLQQLKMGVILFLVGFVVIYPISALYNENKYLGAIACLVACLAYCKIVLHYTSTWMIKLAQQEN